MRIKFKIFPIPKYLSITKKVKPNEKTVPSMELARSMEKVKTSVKKTNTKNAMIAPKEFGSTK